MVSSIEKVSIFTPPTLPVPPDVLEGKEDEEGEQTLAEEDDKEDDDEEDICICICMYIYAASLA